jgi:hypothetical protein
MSDFAQPTEVRSSRTPERSAPLYAETEQFAGRLEAQREFLAKYWFDQISRRVGTDREMETMLKRFLDLLTRMIPGALDHRRSVVDLLWKRAAELYGALGAHRGLAAGDIVEEFQIVREAVIRMLFQVPPAGVGTAPSLSDSLRLNRFIGSGVTHASIGHTDGLFFALFHGNGVPTVSTAQLVVEVDEQLGSLEAEWAAEL